MSVAGLGGRGSDQTRKASASSSCVALRKCVPVDDALHRTIKLRQGGFMAIP